MKKILFLVIILSFTLQLPAQTWHWSNTGGGPGNDGGGKIVKDLNGNIYVGGGVSSINPASVYFNTATFTINGESDMIIAKYDVNGNELWVKIIGGTNSGFPNSKGESITDMYFDSSSNSIYLAGYFFGVCNFTSYTLTACGGTDFFIARMDLNGNFIWVKKGCGFNDDKGGKLTGDNAGSLYVTGVFLSGGNLGGINLLAGQFIAKYDIDGNIYWAKKITDMDLVGTPHYMIINIDYNNNNLYMYGRSIVDNITIDTMTFLAQNYKGVILSKWDTDGNITWGKRFGGPGYSIGSMDIDNTGNFYLNGWYDASISNYAIFDNDTLYATGPIGGFYIKMDNSGNKIWLKNINSSYYHTLHTNSVNSDGSSYLGGRFADTLLIDNTIVISQTQEDVFVAQFDPSGNVIGAVNFGEGRLLDIISDSNNDFIITGGFKGTVNFNITQTSQGGYDLFIAKHDAITRVEELQTVNNQLLIYANPNKGTCTITIPDEFLNEKNLLLQIYDTAGKLLQQSKIEIQQDKIKVNIEAKAKGVYPVVLTNGKKNYNGKIVLE